MSIPFSVIAKRGERHTNLATNCSTALSKSFVIPLALTTAFEKIRI
jgi:hypothetical protein